MDNFQPLPDDFLQLCRSITAKRPKAVIDHILQHGFITTELQVDHRIPFEVDGEPLLKSESFMLLCGSANRVKSWSCEHCDNWRELKSKSICLSCYWAYPENYEHIAMQQVRRIDLLWEGTDIDKYEALKQKAIDSKKDLSELIKEIIEREIHL